jgi:hypothetical protein
VRKRWKSTKEKYIEAYDMVGNGIELWIAQREVNKKSDAASVVKGEQEGKETPPPKQLDSTVGSPTITEAHLSKGDDKREA